MILCGGGGCFYNRTNPDGVVRRSEEVTVIVMWNPTTDGSVCSAVDGGSKAVLVLPKNLARNRTRWLYGLKVFAGGIKRNNIVIL